MDLVLDHLIARIPKFNGMRWREFKPSIRAILLYINALGIAEGVETAPPDEEAEKLRDFDKRERQGRALLLIMCTPSVQNSLDIELNLKENWDILLNKYGTVSAMEVWIDYEAYVTTKYSSTEPMTTQMDEHFLIQSHLINAGILVSESFHTLSILRALPPSYTILVQSILDSTPDVSALTPESIRSRILTEELLQPFRKSDAKVDTRLRNRAKQKERT